jgi:hypothetical protein
MIFFVFDLPNTANAEAMHGSRSVSRRGLVAARCIARWPVKGDKLTDRELRSRPLSALAPRFALCRLRRAISRYRDIVAVIGTYAPTSK